MLKHLSETEAGGATTDAFEQPVGEGGSHTRDMGGQLGTEEVGRPLVEVVADTPEA